MPCVYRYRFGADVCLDDVEVALDLAICVVQSLHGEVRARLDARHTFDRQRRCCVIDSATRVGRSFAKAFTGFLLRVYAVRQFTVQRIPMRPPRQAEAA